MSALNVEMPAGIWFWKPQRFCGYITGNTLGFKKTKGLKVRRISKDCFTRRRNDVLHTLSFNFHNMSIN